MSKNPDHFDHTQRLQRATDLLAALGEHELAGAISSARSLHFNLIGRVSHARQALRKLKRLDGPVSREARVLLERYVAQPEAPWPSPAPVLEETDHE